MTTFLTREGLERLQEELKYLRTIKRQEIAKRLHEAADVGELTENAEFEAAKNEQAFTEGRIQELEILLANAQIIENARKSDVVQLGSIVTIQEDGQKAEKYTIVGPTEASPREGRISHLSPLGQALMNHRVGETVEVKAPDGKFSVHIKKIE
ncbi:MAG: transcription elongation factor GreA [Chloroflexota bacterium]